MVVSTYCVSKAWSFTYLENLFLPSCGALRPCNFRLCIFGEFIPTKTEEKTSFPQKRSLFLFYLILLYIKHAPIAYSVFKLTSSLTWCLMLLPTIPHPLPPHKQVNSPPKWLGNIGHRDPKGRRLGSLTTKIIEISSRSWWMDTCIRLI